MCVWSNIHLKRSCTFLQSWRQYTVNIRIFVRGRVNIIRWIWFLPPRLLREILKSMVYLALSSLFDYCFVSYSNQINLYFIFNRGCEISPLSFLFNPQRFLCFPLKLGAGSLSLSLLILFFFFSHSQCASSPSLFFTWELPSTTAVVFCWQPSSFSKELMFIWGFKLPTFQSDVCFFSFGLLRRFSSVF